MSLSSSFLASVHLSVHWFIFTLSTHPSAHPSTRCSCHPSSYPSFHRTFCTSAHPSPTCSHSHWIVWTPPPLRAHGPGEGTDEEDPTALRIMWFWRYNSKTYFLTLPVTLCKVLQIGKSSWQCLRIWAKLPRRYLKIIGRSTIVKSSANHFKGVFFPFTRGLLIAFTWFIPY